ncbi:BnaC03g27980D [Brassica napus]|uniref:BnaC03g27980D protein n=1 Tax=Brassica napus TaxID=3708 RepID=A0A078H8Y4_BRANA|nr:BnaC03g27980D [Brassica napus]
MAPKFECINRSRNRRAPSYRCWPY